MAAVETLDAATGDPYAAAACRSHDPELFHDSARWPEALAICETCPAWRHCVLDNRREQLGVWGCSERTRQRIRNLGPGATDNDRLRLAKEANRRALVDVGRKAAAKATSYG